jgi:hypothetical protein
MSGIKRILAVTAGLLILWLLYQSVVIIPPISGVVRNAVSNAPIQGASVAVTPSKVYSGFLDSDVRYYAQRTYIADAAGRFSTGTRIALIPPTLFNIPIAGFYSYFGGSLIQPSKEGYYSRSNISVKGKPLPQWYSALSSNGYPVLSRFSLTPVNDVEIFLYPVVEHPAEYATELAACIGNRNSSSLCTNVNVDHIKESRVYVAYCYFEPDTSEGSASLPCLMKVFSISKDRLGCEQLPASKWERGICKGK